MLRGQALRSIFTFLPMGKHTITIQALDPHIVVDQWMLDYDVDREFYVLTVER